MLESWEIDSKRVTPPIQSERLTIDLIFKKGSIAESQPVLSFNKMVLTGDSLEAYQCARAKYGAYQKIPVKYDFGNTNVFTGYLTEPKYLLQRDEIEVKPVSSQSTDGLSEQLSAIESSLLKDLYQYEPLNFVVEKTDLRAEALQLALSTLVYSYILYTQLKEIENLVAEGIEAFTPVGLPTPAPNFGAIASFIIKAAAQVIFLAATVIQLIAYLKQAKELLIPTVRSTKLVSVYELLRVPLSHIGYDFVTDIPELKENFHWASGSVENNEYHPRSSDVCGNALGALNFAIKKYSARVFVRDNTVFVTSYYSPLYFKGDAHTLESFPDGDYEENLDDMVGTREHIYSVDYSDKWTVQNFKGTEYKIRANISDPTKSTVKGLKQNIYGVSLCNRKDSLNILEKAWNVFANFVNSVVEIFGGSGQALLVSRRIGVAKISDLELGLAKLVVVKNKKLPSNHRELLSAKTDEQKFHWVDSHVRNPRAKKKIYKQIPQRYNQKVLSCNIRSNQVRTPEGVNAELTAVKWEKSYNNAALTFEVEDVDRVINLTETFEEPI